VARGRRQSDENEEKEAKKREDQVEKRMKEE
jgi:hypothetical protein